VDTLIALWLGVLAFAGYSVIARRTGDVFHPLAVFVGGWWGVFAFAHLGVPRTYDEPYYALPFGVPTYVAVTLGGLAFIAGYLLIDPKLKALDRVRFWRDLRGSVRLDRLSVVTIVFFAIATATTAYFVVRVGEIPLLSPRINELRRIFKVNYLGYLFDLHYAVALFAAALAVWSERRSTRWFWVVVAVASTALLMTGGVRMSPMTALAWVFVFLAFRPGRARLRQLGVALALSAVMFGVIEGYRRTTYRLDPNRMNPRLDLSAAATLWGHSAASYKNLQVTIQRGSPLHMGITSYDLPKTFHPASREVDAELATLYGTHNTPTFLGFLYFDFGWGGMLLLPALYGALTALVYRRLKRDPRLFWLLVYMDFILAVALAFRTHRFLGNQLIFFMIVGLAVELLVGRKTRPELEADLDLDLELGSPPAPGPHGRIPVLT